MLPSHAPSGKTQQQFENEASLVFPTHLREQNAIVLSNLRAPRRVRLGVLWERLS